MREVGELSAIWRYPVKSLPAEHLSIANLEAHGIPGDRASALFVESVHARTGKTYRGKEDNLLHTAADAESAVAIAASRGIRVALRARGGPYFDGAPISLILDRWIGEVSEALGERLDPLRWRPNLYVRAALGTTLGEHDLLGHAIEAGEAVLRVRCPIERCVATTYDIQTGARNDAVLRYVAQQRASVLGVYCDVEFAGTVRVGDVLRLRAR